MLFQKEIENIHIMHASYCKKVQNILQNCLFCTDCGIEFKIPLHIKFLELRKMQEWSN